MECVVGFRVSLENQGASVLYLEDKVSPQDIADHVEAQTPFEVTCMESTE